MKYFTQSNIYSVKYSLKIFKWKLFCFLVMYLPTCFCNKYMKYKYILHLWIFDLQLSIQCIYYILNLTRISHMYKIRTSKFQIKCEPVQIEHSKCIQTFQTILWHPQWLSRFLSIMHIKKPIKSANSYYINWYN